jgi:hypothetical protein
MRRYEGLIADLQDLRSQGAMPWQWLRRAFRVPGEERGHLTQAAKAALAAVASWILATSVLHLPQPFLAPYAAIFLVESTVYRSVRGGIQQLAAVCGGVVLAASAAQLIPSVTAGLGVVVFVGLLIGAWRGFGESGHWVGITGMLLISYGSATQDSLLVDRLLETAIGAVIGIVVNAVLFPPLYGRSAGAATKRLADALADVLTKIAETICSDDLEDRLDECRTQAADTKSLVGTAEEAISWSREGRWLNLRRRHPDWYESPLVTLTAVWTSVEQLVNAVGAATETDGPFKYPDADSCAGLAVLVDHLADAVRALGDSSGVGEAELERCRESMELVNRSLTTPSGPLTATVGFGGMVLPARNVLRELEKA